MVEEPPILFSPFSPMDCTLFSHFSFNYFISLAFLDLALDPVKDMRVLLVSQHWIYSLLYLDGRYSQRD